MNIFKIENFPVCQVLPLNPHSGTLTYARGYMETLQYCHNAEMKQILKNKMPACRTDRFSPIGENKKWGNRRQVLIHHLQFTINN